MIINLLVSETVSRLGVASEFLEVVDAAIPLLESQARSDLERLAAEEDFEAGEYFMEKDILDHRFQSWIPTVAAYSVIVLIYSIIETQLDALAENLGKRRGAELRVADMRGKGIDRAALYLQRVLSVPVNNDAAWTFIKDMQKIRNIIVHSGGKCGRPLGVIEELLSKHQLELKKIDGIHEQIVIPMSLCRNFASKADAFFDRAFKSAGLPNRRGQRDS